MSRESCFNQRNESMKRQSIDWKLTDTLVKKKGAVIKEGVADRVLGVERTVLIDLKRSQL